MSFLKEGLLVWGCLSKEAADLIMRITNDDAIERSSNKDTLLCYLSDGAMVDLPVAKRVREYKKPHWIPIEFSIKRGK